MRKIIQISAINNRETMNRHSGNILFALCDDGSIYQQYINDGEWYKIEAIPQDSIETKKPIEDKDHIKGGCKFLYVNPSTFRQFCWRNNSIEIKKEIACPKCEFQGDYS